jgi:hypothetical protein
VEFPLHIALDSHDFLLYYAADSQNFILCKEVSAALCSGRSNRSTALCMMVDTEIHNIVETLLSLKKATEL